MSFFEASKEEHAKTGMSSESWRKTAKSLWDAIKIGPHYHGGRECQLVVTCPNYVPPKVK